MMDVDEYLRTSFDDADCEYLDGEVVERNAGEWTHAETMGTLCYLLAEPTIEIPLVQALDINS